MPSKSNVKKSTLNAYEQNLKKLSRDIFGDKEEPTDLKWLEDYDKIMKEINKSPSLHTKKNKVNTVIIYLQISEAPKDIIKKYQDQIQILSKEILKNYNTNTKNEKQEKNWLNYEELINIKNQLLENLPKKYESYADYKKLLYYVMLSVHIELPLRNDLCDVALYKERDFNKIEEDEDVNYIVINKNNGYLILNNYKTASTYGRKKINLPNDIFNLFIKNYEIFKKFRDDDNFIFVNDQKQRLSRLHYTLLFNSLFKSIDINKKISSSMIRHIIISHKFPVKENEMEERGKLADIMGHSTNEALTVYSKA
jgi:hypothetical protein